MKFLTSHLVPCSRQVNALQDCMNETQWIKGSSGTIFSMKMFMNVMFVTSPTELLKHHITVAHEPCWLLDWSAIVILGRLCNAPIHALVRFAAIHSIYLQQALDAWFSP